MFEIIFFYSLSFLVVLFFIKSKNILLISILNGCFSLFTVTIYLLLDAPDVAMTEAVVGVLVTIFSILTIKSLHTITYEINDFFRPGLFTLSITSAVILIYAGLDLPKFGDDTAIANHKTAYYYIQNTKNDINISSIVAAILASYRGYDTLLETLVVVIGGMSVILISQPQDNDMEEMDHLMRIVSRFILPIVFIFSLYLQVHGEISPGGGFQAGTFMAIGFIIYSMLFSKNIFSIKSLKYIAILGIGLYISTGVVGMMNGREFLNYNVFSMNKNLAQQIGIITVELGVGLAVGATMILIFSSLSSNSKTSLIKNICY